jgi:hypothetical protein
MTRAEELSSRMSIISCLRRMIPIIGLLTATGFSTCARAAETNAAQAEAQRLVALAAQAEIDGDSARRISLLNESLRAAPDRKTARWQLGQMQRDGEWVTVEEAQRRAAADPIQAEYRQRRGSIGRGLQDQVALARWCRKNKLNDEAAFHWATVLSLDPKNEEALRALDVRWKNGRLVDRNETAQQKQRAQAAKEAAKYWEPMIAKWRRAVAGRDVQAHDSALSEIRAITRLDAIPSMEAVTLGRDAYDDDHAEECLQIALAFLDALAKLPDQAATESLVRHAVFSPGNKAGTSAIEKIKPRPKIDYVPMLVNNLAMPLESSFDVRTNSDGSVHYTHTLFREGQDSDWSYDLRLSGIQNDMGGRHYTYDFKTNSVEVGPPTSAYPTEIAKRHKITSRYATRYGNTAAATELKVARANESTEFLNSLIMQVLGGTTDQNFETPKAWWDWWRSNNEYYVPEEHPVDRHYYSASDKYYHGQSTYDVRNPPPPPPGRGRSCFAKGTPVWTNIGQKPIETLQLGDLVVAQDVYSGELKYKPVIAITVRPPSAMLKINVEKEPLITTLGHPFWVPGAGWQMAKELDPGTKLHGITGANRIQSIEPAPDAEAYNLVVADFNTYFVGDAGVLVHDNTQRRPVQALVPGIAAK